jgi:hypothetical protein
VIYHGAAKWKVAEKFMGLFECPEDLVRFLPDFGYVVCDVSRFSDEEIKGMVKLKAALLLFRYILHDELVDRLPGILGLLKELTTKRTGMEYLETVLSYLSRGSDRVDEEDLRRAVEEAFPLTGGKIMPTLAEKWIEQGIQQGIQQGMQQGIQQGIQQGMQAAREGVIEILEERFSIVTKSVLRTLKEIDDPDVLKMLYKKALRVGSVQEFRDAMDVVLQ